MGHVHYTDSDESWQAGLLLLGLCPESTSFDVKVELRELLEGHFGQRKTAPMKLRVSHVMNSFDSFLHFTKRHKLKLSEVVLFL
jgi:hypothetical protein